MTKELPQFGRPERTLYYKEEGEIPSVSTRVSLVFGDGIINPESAPQYTGGVVGSEVFLTPRAQSIAEFAAQQVERKIALQKTKDDIAARIVDPWRDILNSGVEPMSRAPQRQIGDTIIILGGFQRDGLPPESLALFGAMMKVTPDLPSLRGVDIHLDGSISPHMRKSFEFIERVFRGPLSHHAGREIESIDVYCPPERARIIFGHVENAGYAVNNRALYPKI